MEVDWLNRSYAGYVRNTSWVGRPLLKCSIREICLQLDPKDLLHHGRIFHVWLVFPSWLKHLKLRKVQVNVIIPSKRCLKRNCRCRIPAWRHLRRVNEEMAKHSRLAEGIGSLTKASGVLDGYPDFEVYTWVWEAVDGGLMDWSRSASALEQALLMNRP
jgi:hypothetical protein